MYAIVKIGGKQYRVEPGQTLVVDRQEGKEGEKLELSSLLYVDGTTVKVGPDATNVAVVAKIQKHLKGEKIDVRRFQAKSRHRRHVGFRPYQTSLVIETIAGKSAPVTAKKAATPKSTKSVK